MIPDILIQEDFRKWLNEDIPGWDISSMNLIEIEDNIQEANIVAKQNGMVSGIHVASVIFKDCDIIAQNLVRDGDIVEKTDILFKLKGKASNILLVERTALNILSLMSGISTETHALMTKIQSVGSKARLAATRKTLPGLRKYQKLAVHIAGGDTHRMSLSSMILLKENHIAAYGNFEKAVNTARRRVSFSQKIEVEVKNESEAIEAAKSKVDIMMLDNFSIDKINSSIPLIRKINPEILIEASGNIDETNLEEYARTGVDIISMGKLTHSVKSFDLSLIFDYAN